jgi:hypothetical protein
VASIIADEATRLEAGAYTYRTGYGTEDDDLSPAPAVAMDETRDVGDNEEKSPAGWLAALAGAAASLEGGKAQGGGARAPTVASNPVTPTKLKLEHLKVTASPRSSAVGAASFECDVCNKKFMLANSLQQHLLTHMLSFSPRKAVKSPSNKVGNSRFPGGARPSMLSLSNKTSSPKAKLSFATAGSSRPLARSTSLPSGLVSPGSKRKRAEMMGEDSNGLGKLAIPVYDDSAAVSNGSSHAGSSGITPRLNSVSISSVRGESNAKKRTKLTPTSSPRR